MITFPKLNKTLLFAILLLSVQAFSQSDKERVDSYISQYKNLAIAEMVRTGVPASITLAQGILETAGGQSDLASEANNHFGIKCKNNWTGESMLHNDDAKNECFRKYPSVEDSYKDHSDFLKSRPNYAFLFKLDPTDFEGWAKGLKRSGYATNPNYAQLLIKLIVENNLQQYSLAVLHRQDSNDEMLASSNGVNQTNGTENNTAESNENAIQDEVIAQPVSIVQPTAKVVAQKTSTIPEYPVNKIFTINDVKVIYAKAGTSLLALANYYNTALKKLIEYNDLEETEILSSNQLIFLEKKSKKGIKEIHIVEPNETLHDISQKEGMQLSVIMEYNNLKKGMQPALGERIYLKNSAPVSPKLASATDVKNVSSM
jgi:hypothetical protein